MPFDCNPFIVNPPVVLIPVNVLSPLKFDLLFICVCISDVIFVKYANLEFETPFKFPDTIKLFPYVVVNEELLYAISTVLFCSVVIFVFIVVK